MDINATVAIERCDSYDFDNIFTCIRRICDYPSFPEVKGKAVLVKPNILSDAKPEDCITTHPEVVRAVVRLLKEKGAGTILVGDSPGLHNPGFAAKNCGIGKVCKDEGVQWIDFTKNPVTKQIAGTRHKEPMTNAVDKVDYIFSVCKFKTHQLMYATGATKNLFGLIPNISKAACHVKFPNRNSFAKLIVGIHETVKPAFCIMDAIIGMEGAGPANGTPRAVNLLMASDNCFAMDEAQARIMGYSPSDIPILKEAARRHLLPKAVQYPILDPKDLMIEDFERIEISEQTNFFTNLILPFFTRGMQKRKQKKEPAPQFNDQTCIRCLRCVNICPPKALTLTQEEDGTKHVVCDYEKCIRCYCCHEMCPVNAIHVPAKESK